MLRFLARLVPLGRLQLGAAATLLLLAGCNLRGPQSTFETKGPVARTQLEVFNVTWYVTLGIFIVVGLTLTYATIRYRARTKADEHAEPPPQSHGNPLVEFGLVAASIACLVVIAVPTLRGISYTYAVPAAEKDDALVVNAVGAQWWFRFEYPSISAALGNGAQAPLATGNELVIPVGRPVHINLRTSDVMHSFWVPKLAGKVDMIPNRGNHLWLRADEPGYYFGQCAEFCGESHAVMRFRVIALEPAAFDAWVARQTKPAATPAPDDALTRAADAPRFQLAGFKLAGASGATYGEFDGDLFAYWHRQQQPTPVDAALASRGRQLFTEKTCAGCHTVRGHDFGGVTGPDLTHFASRTTLAAGLVDNTDANLRIWITHPESVKPGNKMAQGYRDNQVTVVPADADALVAYLRSLH
ncbi:MAG TPA: cytochrome c oxidase subunit II [Opitutaceae bacterium]|nr:cytochrome c oxidase subunit II [Opitutaceae bacterium]